MTSRLPLAALYPPILGSGRSSLMHRALEAITHPLAWIADTLNPVRVCQRLGHVPGHDVFAFEAWDLDQRYPGDYIGYACGRCGQLAG